MRPIWTVPALLAVALGVVACDGSGTKPGEVPRVEGVAQAEAEAKIKKFCPEALVRYEPADIVALAGKQKVNMANVVVLSQDKRVTGALPAPSRPPSVSPLPRPSGRGCSDSGTLTVTLKLAVKVPQLVGETVENAQILLQQSGLAPADKPPAGHHVLSQKPAFGDRPVPLTKIPAGTVTLDLDVKVPNVFNRTAKDACALLTQVRLVCDANDVSPTSLVQSQMPPADSFLKPGDHVKLGTTPIGTTPQFPMPNVVGKGSKEACAILMSRQLKCEARETEALGDEPFPVTDSDPKPGAPVAAGVRATVFVPQPRKVPLLKGLDQNSACRLVQELGLGCSFVEVRDISLRGTVVDQSPAEGTARNKGATVTINTASGIEVPYVLGISVKEACDQLVSRELSCDRGTNPLDWIVTGQSAEPWTPAKRLDKIILTAQAPKPSAKTCDGVKLLGQCTDMITLITTAVGVGGFILAVLEFRRRRGQKEGQRK